LLHLRSQRDRADPRCAVTVRIARFRRLPERVEALCSRTGIALRHNAVRSPAGPAPARSSTNGNYTAGPVRCIGGLCGGCSASSGTVPHSGHCPGVPRRSYAHRRTSPVANAASLSGVAPCLPSIAIRRRAGAAR
jgi:hypothetical protein